jgi:DNA modification methylase
VIVCGDARRIPLADETVQCCVTSPPYWGLRRYAGEQELDWSDGWRGAYGLEPTVEMYVAHTVEILREIRRVLRPDGAVFWNVGDSYAGSWGNQSRKPDRGTQRPINGKMIQAVHDGRYPSSETNTGKIRDADLKPKDLCLIPMRVALAAQADGWWVRSDIIWSKPNPMPESVRDRPTDAYEHILMLTKSARYFWDPIAVAEPSKTDDIRRPYTSEGAWELDGRPNEQRHGGKPRGGVNAFRGQGHFRDGENGPANREGREMKEVGAGVTRNLRNVWEFATQPYKHAHFATFPEELPRRCIKAATSEKGCCPQCGAPWVRIVERKSMEISRTDWGDKAGNRTATSGTMTAPPESKTLGWRPDCNCDREPVPCLVLDPFGGSGTTAKVAIELGRRAVSLDLAYHPLAKKRTKELQPQLLSMEA